MVGQRVRSALDREPIWRRVNDRVRNRASSVRNRPGRALKRRLPQFQSRNFGGGLAVGAAQAGVAIVLERTLGIPFGAETEISDVRSTGRGTVYVVNVNAPFQNMADVRAFIESGTGFTTFLTEEINVQSSQVLKTRMFRDTYQIEILVED